MNSIPASQIVNVLPSVLAAGGSALDLNGLILTNGMRVPIGTVQSFPNAAAVATYFGVGSNLATMATVYFNGYDGSTAKPGALLVAQYNTSGVSAFLRGGNISGLTLAQLNAISGTVNIVVDGVARTSTVDLSSATSFSNAASIIATALNLTLGSGTVTGSISGTVMTVTVNSGVIIAPGSTVTGAGVTANTKVTSYGTGNGGIGTYNVNNSQTVSSESLTIGAAPVTVTYDSTSGAFVVTSGLSGNASTIDFATGTAASALLLQAAQGAVLSQGAKAAQPVAFMNALAGITQNWASFTTAFDPDSGTNTNKLLFASWANSTNNRYAYVALDSDVTPTQSTNATTSLGYIVTIQLKQSGTIPLYSSTFDTSLAAFVLGAIASINFSELNGRTTLAFRSQSGLTPSVTDAATAANLLANGYNYYGAYATAADGFNLLYDGSISGQFQWVDSYVNQIWLNNALQLALVELLVAAKSIPYNAAGYGRIKAAVLDPINQALDFGAIRTGVTLSASQAASINAGAGIDVATVVSQRGYYFQILDPTPQVRAARASPPCTLWYADGGSVQQINLSSIAVQ